MQLTQIKNKMYEWTDFYGGDIPDQEAIRQAKTKDELAQVLSKHKRHLEDMLSDAISHLDSFKNELGL
jgi:hypothetical protein